MAENPDLDPTVPHSIEDLIAASSLGTPGAMALRQRGKAAREEFILREAAKLLRKYFHPSRLGFVPDPELAEQLAVAETLLQLAAVRARKDAEPGEQPSWVSRNQAAAELRRDRPGVAPFTAFDVEHLLDTAAATGHVVTAAVSIRYRALEQTAWFSVLWHDLDPA